MRTWLIIGSTAARHWFPDARVPADIDLLTPAKITGNHSTTCVVDSQWHSAAQGLIDQNIDPVFADPDLLYTLKVSHAHWSIKWDKTLFDIKFLSDHGCKLLRPQYTELVQVWEQIHGKKIVNLARPIDEFFMDSVGREFNHEWLHELVAFNGRPMHERMRPDSDTAWCSVELFESLTPDEQAQAALEEIMAVAIERRHLRHTSLKSEVLSAMKHAHQQLCTSMTKGWFALYLITHAHELLITRRAEWLPIINQALKVLERPSPAFSSPRTMVP